MTRRSALQVALAMASASLLSAHAPLRQGNGLRAAEWLIVAARGDDDASRLAGAAAALVAARVPGSKAMAVAADNDREVVRLLRTHQAELAVMSIDAANEALSGVWQTPRGAPVPLRTVAPFGSHLLVAFEDYPVDKAARIAAALAGFRWRDGSAPTRGAGPQSNVPLHPGAIRFKQARDAYKSQ